MRYIVPLIRSCEHSLGYRCWLCQGEPLCGFDHGAGHPRLFLDDAKAPNCQKNNGFNDLGNYSEWPKVAGAVIQAASAVRSCAGRLGNTVRS